MYNYTDYTLNSKNPLRRFSHRSRYKISVRKVLSLNPSTILDYGCGSISFFQALKEDGFKGSYVGYDPEGQAGEHFSNNWENVKSESFSKGKFSCISCFEVLEHFNSSRQLEHLQKMFEVLSPEGYVLISVPVEIGPVSFLKNIMRFRPFQEQYGGINVMNVLRSLFFLPTPKYRASPNYLGHMGFDYRQLLLLLQDFGKIVDINFSPLVIGGHWLNSQVFILLQKSNN